MYFTSRSYFPSLCFLRHVGSFPLIFQFTNNLLTCDNYLFFGSLAISLFYFHSVLTVCFFLYFFLKRVKYLLLFLVLDMPFPAFIASVMVPLGRFLMLFIISLYLRSSSCFYGKSRFPWALGLPLQNSSSPLYQRLYVFLSVELLFTLIVWPEATVPGR